jgi:hypothetical protein
MLDDGCRTQGCGDATIYGQISVLLYLVNITEDSEKKQYYQEKAVAETQRVFNIDTPKTNELSTEIRVGGLNESYPGAKGNADPKPNDASTMMVSIYDTAFTSTPGDLAATISHEFCHVAQAGGLSCLPTDQEMQPRLYSGNIMGSMLNEYEARRSIVYALGDYGYGTPNGITQERVNQYISDMQLILDNYHGYENFMAAIADHSFILQEMGNQ